MLPTSGKRNTNDPAPNDIAVRPPNTRRRIPAQLVSRIEKVIDIGIDFRVAGRLLIDLWIGQSRVDILVNKQGRFTGSTPG